MAGEVDVKAMAQRMRDHARLGRVPNDVAIDCARAAELLEQQHAVIDAIDSVLHTMEAIVRQAFLRLKENAEWR